jgi:hypothetical protein
MQLYVTSDVACLQLMWVYDVNLLCVLIRPRHSKWIWHFHFHKTKSNCIQRQIRIALTFYVSCCLVLTLHMSRALNSWEGGMVGRTRADLALARLVSFHTSMYVGRGSALPRPTLRCAELVSGILFSVVKRLNGNKSVSKNRELVEFLTHTYFVNSWSEVSLTWLKHVMAPKLYTYIHSVQKVPLPPLHFHWLLYKLFLL